MNKTIFIAILSFFLFLNVNAKERELIWPNGKMPDTQSHQIAAMTNECNLKEFNPDKHRTTYIEWFDSPSPQSCNGGCMVLISGGSYKCCCDVDLIELWNKEFTKLGFKCVNLVYRTPRPNGIPIYQTAWEDGQRAIRVIRSEAQKRGFDPEKIGVISMSAGSHLALLLGTSSMTKSYETIDDIDTISCHINWAIVNAPAYVTNDAETGTPASRDGYGTDVRISNVFKFDEKTCPMSLHHGGLDPYSPNGSTLVYRELRKRMIPAEIHLYPDLGHGAFGLERGIEFMRQMGFIPHDGKEVDLMSRFTSDSCRSNYLKEDIWPEGKTPDFQKHQCSPYIEWHFPKERKTSSIQIIYSGGAYRTNDTNGFEVAPTRRYLNEKGMTVVTLKYRTPRPEGLAKHTTAWQDLQRAVRIVRSKAASYGLNPDRIGIMGGSAGGHLTLMGCTSSNHRSYLPIDDIDKLPCNVQWGIGIYPAYSLTDGPEAKNKTGGNADDAVPVPEFTFDLNTCPMLFVHGDDDDCSPMNSVKCWEKMRSMGIQSEVHSLATRKHCFQLKAIPGTGSYTYIDRIWEFINKKGLISK